MTATTMADVMPRTAHLPMRRPNDFAAVSSSGFHANKEAEWSRVCDNVLGDYLADDDVFGLTSWQHERSSSNDSAGVWAYSMSSGQSNQTSGTSPDPSWLEQVAVTAAALDNPMSLSSDFMNNEYAIIDTPATSPQKEVVNTQNPESIRVNKPQSFWDKAVSRLERGAKAVSSRKERLRTSKSHPDFLSLGGHPSPAPVPHPVPQIPIVPVPDPGLIVARTRGRAPANGKQRSTSQLRSVSRGRPQGVAKPGTRNASPRKGSLSPAKMMQPSRYRAGVQEALAEQLADHTMKAARQHHQSLPAPPPAPSIHMLQQQQVQRQHRMSFPASPPNSTQVSQQDFTAFGASPMPAPVPAFHNQYDNELSPLTSTFQQARLHTPDASPFFSQVRPDTQSYFDNSAALTNYTTAVPLNDTSSLVSNRIGSFDFGFNAAPTGDVWPVTSFGQATTTALSLPAHTAYAHQPTLHQLENAAGLGITCDSSVFVGGSEEYSAYQNLQAMQAMKACYPPMPQQAPTTPQKQMEPSSPSTDSRVRRSSGGSGLRRVSKHRRTKSTTSLPRQVQSAERGGFVNFTPDDCNKILNGVAPSGSSKTKARREKEAADKRRRLSQAAIKAVLEAGGDAEELVKAGFDV